MPFNSHSRKPGLGLSLFICHFKVLQFSGTPSMADSVGGFGGSPSAPPPLLLILSPRASPLPTPVTYSLSEDLNFFPYPQAAASPWQVEAGRALSQLFFKDAGRIRGETPTKLFIRVQSHHFLELCSFLEAKRPTARPSGRDPVSSAFCGVLFPDGAFSRVTWWWWSGGGGRH